MSSSADVRVDNHGSVVLLTPLTDAAEQWMVENIPDAQHWVNARVVEPRYVETVLDGMITDGLEVVC